MSYLPKSSMVLTALTLALNFNKMLYLSYVSHMFLFTCWLFFLIDYHWGAKKATVKSKQWCFVPLDHWDSGVSTLAALQQTNLQFLQRRRPL